MQSKFSIGKTTPKNNLVLAPLAAISDLPFRLLCRDQGAGLCFTEMINSEAVARNNKSAFSIALSRADDKPLGLQLFGARVDSMKKAGTALDKKADFDFFDLNFGCPDENVLKQGAGSALLKRPARAAELVRALRETGRDVSAKIRLSPNVLSSIKFCRALEAAGVSCISVHGRIVKQKYSGAVDFVAIKRIAKSVSVPVIANGNLRTAHDVEKTLRETRASAAMIGRAAIGNPGIFAEFQGRRGIRPVEAMFKYVELSDEFGLNRFGKLKTQIIRFLAKEKLGNAIFDVQKARDRESVDAALSKIE